MPADSLPCPPPDPNPRTPKLSAPAGTCDTHAHVFGPQSKYPYSSARGYTPPDAPYEAYRALHEALGVSRGVLTQPSVYGTDNTAMLDAVARDPANMRAVAAVGADVTDDELRRLNEAGVRGIRVNLVDKGGMPFDSFADVEKFADRVVPMGWHIEYLVHVHDFPDLDVLGRLPADSVIGHFGYMHISNGVDHPGFQSFLRLFEKGRVWVKMTAPYRLTDRTALPYDDLNPVGQSLRETRPDRLLWGTDWPHPINPKPMANDGDMFDELATWLPDEALRQQVLVDNPKALYGFD
ncbi:MAG: amidohydrolase family protein [Pseudomonadota bacterium]